MNIMICRTGIEQVIGLMFRRTPTIAIFPLKRPGTVVIHTWFMFYPIDIYLLDVDCNIIETKRNVKSFSFYKSRSKPKYILEVPV